MTLALLLTEPITVTTRSFANADVYGNPVPTDDSPVYYLGRLEETNTEEVLVGEDKVITTWRLFLFPDAVIDSTAMVQGRDRTFEVVGDPKLEYSPRGPHHWEARLREVTYPPPEMS